MAPETTPRPDPFMTPRPPLDRKETDTSSDDPQRGHEGDLDPDALLAKVEALEERLSTVQARIEYALKLVAPPLFFLFMLAVIYLFYPTMFAETIARITSTLVLGKFAAAGGQEDFFFWLIVLGTIDVLVGLWLLWNFDLLFKLPYVGPRFRRFEAFGRTFLGQHQWVRRTAFLGIVLIVIVPFQGTGAVMGSIVGRMIGMGPLRAFAAIAIGAYTGFALMLGGSAAITHAFQGSLVFGLLLAAGVVVGLAAVWWRWFRTKRVTGRVEAPVEGET
ncbi:MAG: small multi-drug export protein [Euryarchaeota archaeon]|nr:small multi-drug export protein [Euryarchaeota archaeon]